MSGEFFGSLGNSFAVNDGGALRAALDRVDVTVPRRTEGRRSAHRERFCIVHYLRTLERNDLLRFPFRISKSERPDFRIEMAGAEHGIEVTEAGNPKLQEAVTALEKAPAGAFLEGNVVRRPGQRLQDRGYFGDEPERLWTQEALSTIQKKTAQLGRYPDLSEHHLLIYDNSGFAALTAWSVTDLPARLAAAIAAWERPRSDRRFELISVLRDRVLMYDVTGRSYVLPVPPSPSLPALLPLSRLGVGEVELQDFCRRHGIRKLGFFGSARGERFRPGSDIDVLVEFEPDQRIGLIGLAGVEIELSRLLGRKADLRTVPDLSRYFREEVVREKSDLVYAHAAG